MKRAVTIVLVVIALTAVLAAQDKQTQAAQKSAESWLAMVDSGSYDGSWDEAASIFKNAITKEQWKKAVTTARGPLGKLVSRKLKSAQFTTELPGAPDGKYVVIQYETSFENKKSAVETITPMLDKDGQWRVSGYFIR
ncbi:MAG TPA: DUF4019 domain-containing protein [Terriglobales bacterium]|nr:DUF4019 domain-containing protein [Terriglobales bacterium]